MPYTPEQNAIVERAITMVFKIVWCMLHSAGMDLHYWGKAFLYAINIQSCSPTYFLSGIVPLEAWTDKKPDIYHIWIPSSVTYTNILKKLHGGKLEVTSVKCHLLGWWTDETKGYQLEDVETRKLIMSQDIHFIKDDSSEDLAVIET